MLNGLLVTLYAHNIHGAEVSDRKILEHLRNDHISLPMLFRDTVQKYLSGKGKALSVRIEYLNKAISNNSL